jgi:hypothetical protein
VWRRVQQQWQQQHDAACRYQQKSGPNVLQAQEAKAAVAGLERVARIALVNFWVAQPPAEDAGTRQVQDTEEKEQGPNQTNCKHCWSSFSSADRLWLPASRKASSV